MMQVLLNSNFRAEETEAETHSYKEMGVGPSLSPDLVLSI